MTEFKPTDETVRNLKLEASDPLRPHEIEQLDFLFQPGSVIGGQYEVLSVLGSGGMSDVYTCEDKVLKRTVAVKVMRATGVTNAQLLRRFQTEGKAIAKIRHDNIIDIYGLHTDGGIPFLVMEYLSGEPLSKLIAHEKQLTVQRTLNIAGQICDGLASAHQQGVIHRDLKPSNIIVMNLGTMREKVKILDFGIAKIKEESGKTLTKTGDIFGTPQYMSPEQAQGKDCDARSDQYSLGCMIYEMLAGKPPFSGDNHLATMMAHLNEKPLSLSKVSRLVPPHVAAAVEVMLAKEPEKRFATISDARAALFGSTLQKGSLKKWLAIGAVVVCMAVATAICIGYLNKTGESTPANLGSLPDAAPTMQTAVAARERPADLEFKRWCRAHPQAISFDNKDDPLFRRELSDAALVNLTQMVPNLQSMNLSGCALVTNKGLHDLAGLQLSKLDLSGTDIKDDSLKALASMTSLRELNLGNTDVGDKACSSLVGLTDLQTLFLGHTKISQSGVADLSKIRSLNVLFLDTCTIPGAIASLQNLNLCYLNLSNAKLNADDIAALVKMKSLRYILLSGTDISNDDLTRLSNMHWLRVLDVRSCRRLDEKTIRLFSKKNGSELHSDTLEAKYRGDSDEFHKPFLAQTRRTKVPGDLAINGSFDGQVPKLRSELHTGSDVIRGWRIFAGSVDLVSNKSWQAAEGTTSLDLNGNQPGGIEQIINTKPGVHYSVKFWYTSNPDAEYSVVPTFMVKAADESFSFTAKSDPRPTSESMHWQEGEVTFMAKEKRTPLRFISTTPDLAGPCLDNVTVVPVSGSPGG